MKVGHCGCDQQDVNPLDMPPSPIPSETQPEVFSSSHSYFLCMGFAVKLMIFSWKSLNDFLSLMVLQCLIEFHCSSMKLNVVHMKNCYKFFKVILGLLGLLVIDKFRLMSLGLDISIAITNLFLMWLQLCLFKLMKSWITPLFMPNLSCQGRKWAIEYLERLSLWDRIKSSCS
jgi:hypothetical protein